MNGIFRDIARTLRKNSTDTEKYLWRYLRNKQIEGFKFRRQQSIGKYIVDFVNFEMRLIVEVDGGQHNIYKQKDKIRDGWLKKEGDKVLRFWDNEVLLTPHPNPLPCLRQPVCRANGTGRGYGRQAQGEREGIFDITFILLRRNKLCLSFRNRNSKGTLCWSSRTRKRISFLGNAS